MLLSVDNSSSLTELPAATVNLPKVAAVVDVLPAVRTALRFGVDAVACAEKVRFCSTGSEATLYAMRLARAFTKKDKILKFEGGYHGMGFGGLTVGGIGRNRRQFGPLLPGADHLRSVLAIERNAFSRGLPEYGSELADDLLRIVNVHGAGKIAAVIVEPITGAGGVVLPPEGYLHRLREICTEHGILLIFDEVITGFGRVGDSCAAKRFGITPDIITTAKGISNATIPLGGVFVSDAVYDVFQSAPDGIELFHGYTYSGHPVACAAGMATLSIYEKERLFERGRDAEALWLDSALALREAPGVIDILSLIHISEPTRPERMCECGLLL